MARIFIAATAEDARSVERILGNDHEYCLVTSMPAATTAIKEDQFDLIMIGVHFDQSRMFDLLRELHKARYDETPVICFCIRNTALTQTAHESIDVASKALGAWMYLDYQKYSDTDNPDDELRRVIGRCLTGEARKEIQAERVDIHKRREHLLRLRQALADEAWSVELEDRVAELRERLAEVLLELSELQIASIAHQELVAESNRRADRVSPPVQTAENSMGQEETQIGIRESEQLGQEQEVVPSEEAKSKEGRRKLLAEEEEEGKSVSGSTIRESDPVRLVREPTPAIRSGNAESLSTNTSPSILIVEDDLTQQMVMRVLCEKLGFTVYIVSSGAEAIRAVETCDGCFDAILMDWRMPVMSGADTTQGIRAIERAKGTRTPILAVTADVTVQDRVQSAGMDDFLAKPFTADDFRGMLLRWTYSAGRPNLKLLPGYKSASQNSKQNTGGTE